MFDPYVTYISIYIPNELTINVLKRKSSSARKKNGKRKNIATHTADSINIQSTPKA